MANVWGFNQRANEQDKLPAQLGNLLALDLPLPFLKYNTPAKMNHGLMKIL